jgi:multidrug efflux pump subunit AcrA (membrane-fusion protein)
VTAALERESGAARLLPGMLVRLRIAVGLHAQALVVPKRAFSREGGQGHVYAVRESTARRIEVEEGYSDDQRVELLVAAGARLEPGEHVILVGSRDIEDGTLVDAELETRPAPHPSAPPADPVKSAAASADTEPETSGG